MSDLKKQYTKIFLECNNIPFSDTEINDYMKLWWYSPREKQIGGLRLTEKGFLCVQTGDIKYYSIDLKDEITSSKDLLILDRFIECPFFLSKKRIYVLTEKIATQLILFSGDFRLFGKNKMKNTYNHLK